MPPPPPALGPTSNPWGRPRPAPAPAAPTSNTQRFIDELVAAGYSPADARAAVLYGQTGYKPPSGGGGGPGPDHFFDVNPLDQAAFDSKQKQQQWQNDYDAAKVKADKAKSDFQQAMDVGDFQLAQKKQDDLNYWQGISSGLEQQKVNLTNQGQQLDYKAQMANVEAKKQDSVRQYQIGMANASNEAERTQVQDKWNQQQALISKMENDTRIALGQQQNQTAQYGQETARQEAEQRYQVGLANATTDAERVAVEERKRQDDVAVANMQDKTRWDLGQQGNQIESFNAETGRQKAEMDYRIGMAGAATDAERVAVEDRHRQDLVAIANMEEENKFNLGQQGNQTGQFGAETDRAARMGNLALDNNKFILDASGKPRNLMSLFFMQRGIAPDWDAMARGETPGAGNALVPADVMGAYKPTTAAPTFDLKAAQAKGQAAGTGSNLSQWLKEPGDLTYKPGGKLPTFNGTHTGAVAQPGSGYDSTKNPFLKKGTDFQPTTGAPTFNLGPSNLNIVSGNTARGAGGNSFIRSDPFGNDTSTPGASFIGYGDTSAPKGPGKTNINLRYDVNADQRGGVPLASLHSGMNLATVGNGARGSDFDKPAYYDEAKTRRVGQDDVIEGGSQVWIDNMANGGMTTARQFIVGDHPSGKPTGQEELVGNPTGAPLSVMPLNSPNRPVPRYAFGTAYDQRQAAYGRQGRASSSFGRTAMQTGGGAAPTSASAFASPRMNEAFSGGGKTASANTASFAATPPWQKPTPFYGGPTPNGGGLPPGSNMNWTVGDRGKEGMGPGPGGMWPMPRPFPKGAPPPGGWSPPPPQPEVMPDNGPWQDGGGSGMVGSGGPSGGGMLPDVRPKGDMWRPKPPSPNTGIQSGPWQGGGISPPLSTAGWQETVYAPTHPGGDIGFGSPVPPPPRLGPPPGGWGPPPPPQPETTPDSGYPRPGGPYGLPTPDANPFGAGLASPSDPAFQAWVQRSGVGQNLGSFGGIQAMLKRYQQETGGGGRPPISFENQGGWSGAGGNFDPRTGRPYPRPQPAEQLPPRLTTGYRGDGGFDAPAPRPVGNFDPWSTPSYALGTDYMPRYALGTQGQYNAAGMGGQYQNSSTNEHLSGYDLPSRLQMLQDYGAPIAPSLADATTGRSGGQLNTGRAFTQMGGGGLPSLQGYNRMNADERDLFDGYVEGPVGMPMSGVLDWLGRPTQNLQQAQRAR